MNLVMDACALIADLQDEPGGELVDKLLLDETHVCYIHQINLCEVYYDYLRTDGKEKAGSVLEDLKASGIIISNDMDEELMKCAGYYKAEFRQISLADCFCLALAERIGAQVVTSDRREFTPIVQRNLCEIRFIR